MLFVWFSVFFFFFFVLKTQKTQKTLNSDNNSFQKTPKWCSLFVFSKTVFKNSFHKQAIKDVLFLLTNLDAWGCCVDDRKEVD